MAGERYVQKAVLKLSAYINSNLPAQLRAVETAQSLTTDSLTDPIAVVQYRAPFDNRSPLVEVFDESWEFIDHINKLVSVDCTIALSYVGDASIENGEIFMRRYITALLDTLMGDTTLGSTVVAAIPTDGSSAITRGDNATTRHVYTQGVDVHVFQGGG